MSTESNEAPHVPTPPPYASAETQDSAFVPPQPPQAPSTPSTADYEHNYGSPYSAPQKAPESAPYGAQQHADGYSYGQPAPVFYPGQGQYPPYGQFQPQKSEAQQLASNSLTMGIIGFCLTLLIGWVPIFGLVGVAGGLGLGIPAILQSSKSSRLGGEATAGKVLGWLAVALSILWVAFYMMLMMIGFVNGDNGGARTTSA